MSEDGPGDKEKTSQVHADSPWVKIIPVVITTLGVILTTFITSDAGKAVITNMFLGKVTQTAAAQAAAPVAVAGATIIVVTPTAQPSPLPTDTALPTSTITAAPSTSANTVPNTGPTANQTATAQPTTQAGIFASGSAEQVVLAFYNALNSQNYQAAWQLTTDKYRKDRQLSEGKFENFYQRYKEIRFTYESTRRTSDYVIVRGLVVYVSPTGLEDAPIRTDHFLIPNSSGNSGGLAWIMDGAAIIR